MSPDNSEELLEEVLLSFSVEPAHDRATLERYLKLYPQFANDLVDMSHELRLPGRGPSSAAEEESVFQRAWTEFSGTATRDGSSSVPVNPFEAFQGPSFAALAATLRIPRSILIALRDRLIIASTIPTTFMARVARATRSTVTDLSAYLELPSVIAPGANYKADEKPSATAKVAFEQLLDASRVGPSQKADIYTATE